MAQLHFSDEILMAFADGELDDQVASTVEEAMSRDLVITRRVAAFLRSRHLARSAFPRASASDVPPALLATVQAQIARFEGHASQPATSERAHASRRIASVDRRPFGWALAASFAAIAIATGGYWFGHQAATPSPIGPIAQLATPEVSRALNDAPSGQDHDLSFGRMRVISTFRTADGSLCREFKIQAASGTSDAVACRGHDWVVTFAFASDATSGAYVPSDGADLMTRYLQDVGAGEPLLGSEEAKALSDPRLGK